MKKRILSALLIFTMATIIIPIHAETKLPAGYVQMAKSNPKISGDSEYYTHVKYYSEPITIIARNQLKRIKDTFSYIKIIRKYPAFRAKVGYFHGLFSIDPASLISYVYASVVYSVLTYIITWISILCGCVLRDINTEKIITT